MDNNSWCSNSVLYARYNASFIDRIWHLLIDYLCQITGLSKEEISESFFDTHHCDCLIWLHPMEQQGIWTELILTTFRDY